MAKSKKKGELDIPTHIMSDLCSRFVINCDNLHLNPLRVFYMTEHAYWHYIDFYCNEQPQLPKCGHKALTKHIFSYLPDLNHFLTDFDTLYQEWSAHKRSTPSYGGILLSPDYKHVLMVQGYNSKTSWGFPKGKMETHESEIECAIREIDEETGINVTNMIQEDAKIECWFQDQFTQLYIIPGIQTDSMVQPKLRKEIREYRWYPVEALPTSKNDQTTKNAIGMEANHFFKVIPFVKKLRAWISKELGPHQPMPASQFTALGRRGKDRDGQRRQGPPGPHGDAPSSREGQGRGSRQGQVVRNLNDQFSGMAVGGTGQQGKRIQILARGGGAASGGGGRKDQHQEADTKPGKSKTKATDKPTNIGKLRLDEFHSKALLNFKFEVEPILDCLTW